MPKAEMDSNLSPCFKPIRFIFHGKNNQLKATGTTTIGRAFTMYDSRVMDFRQGTTFVHVSRLVDISTNLWYFIPKKQGERN